MLSLDRDTLASALVTAAITRQALCPEGTTLPDALVDAASPSDTDRAGASSSLRYVSSDPARAGVTHCASTAAFDLLSEPITDHASGPRPLEQRLAIALLDQKHEQREHLRAQLGRFALTRELVTRWVELAAIEPVAHRRRTSHATRGAREPCPRAARTAQHGEAMSDPDAGGAVLYFRMGVPRTHAACPAPLPAAK